MSAAFQEYVKYNLRSIPELAQKKGASLSYALYKATPVVSMGDIRAKLQSLGWQVKRIYSGRRKKGETNAQALTRMHNSIAVARFASAKFMASGWLPAVYKFRGGGDSAPTKVSNPSQRGYANIHISDTESYIEIVNSTPGIATLESKRPFVQIAIDAEVKDMWDYIARKQRENATVFNRSGKA